MKYILFSLVSLLLGSLVLYSCANRGVPTGGPKDTIPPHLVKVIPENKSLNFNGDEVVLTFDEFIKTEDIANQLIITPRLKEGEEEEEETEYKLNKNTLTIALNAPLDSNTTYTFNFQESVQDITESNPAQDLVIAFSTGDYIDSLFIEGQIIELLTNKVREDVIVALYPASDTLDLFNSKPQYFTKTDKEGNFRLENLKNASYKIYAFLDKNKNLTAQSNSEPYGFIAETIVLDSSISNLHIPIIKRDVTAFKLQSARPNGQYYEIKLSKYIEDYELTVLEDKVDSLISNKALNEQSIIKIYNTITVDSIKTKVNAIDTIGQHLIDTFYVKFPPTKRKLDPVSYETSIASNGTIEEDYSAQLSFSKPIAFVNLDSAFFYYNRLSVDTLRKEDLSWNKFHDKLTLSKKLDKKRLEMPSETKPADSIPSDTLNNGQAKVITEEELPEVNGKEDSVKNKTSEKTKFDKQDHQVMLFLAKGTFISIEQDTLPEITGRYSFAKSEDVGLIKGTIITEEESYFIQLLNNSFKVIKETKGMGNDKFTFNLIPPGEYTLRILIDNNGDGIWYPGNIKEQIPPESIYFYSGPVVIRANWERELDEISF